MLVWPLAICSSLPPVDIGHSTVLTCPKSGIRFFPVVKEKLSILDLSRRARSTRLLSYALLFLVAYSTTVEAVHTHKNLLAGSTEVSSACLSDSNAPTQPRTQSPAGECLACQFQHNLSSAELFTPLLILAPVASRPVTSTAVVEVSSLSPRTGHGRAPPVTC